VDIPSQADRPEGRPSSVRSELGRTVESDRGIQQVTIAVSITGISDESHQAGNIILSRRQIFFCILGCKSDKIQFFIRKTFCSDGIDFAFIALNIPGYIRIQGMILYLLEITEHDVAVIEKFFS